MSFLFRYIMDRDEARPGEREELGVLMEETIRDWLENFEISYRDVYSGATDIWVDSDVRFGGWDVEITCILEELEAVLDEAGIGDVAVYYEESYYGIVVDYQNWNGELSGDAEVWGDIQVQLELIYADHEGEENSQWLYLQLDAAELENMAVSNWYGIRVYRMLSEEQGRFWAGVYNWRHAHLAGGQYAACSYEMLEEEEQERLAAAYRIDSSPDFGAEEDQIVGRIGYDTAFAKAEIYDVGQALCVGIFEAFSYDGGQHVQERLAAFFDFGIPYTAGRPRPGAARDYQTICAEIAAFVNSYGRGRETRDRIHIVLSHWHLDHCILAKCLTANELSHTVWHVPCEGLGPSARGIRSHIVANGGRVEALADHFDALHLEGNENLRYGKIDYGFKRNQPPAVIRASRHPHHHGMYMIVELESGNKLFLSGDCTYAGISGRLKAEGFHYLQASHHGGNYALSPASRNFGDIPRPAGGGGLICSCGPYSEQHHPNQAVLADHGNAGWTAVHVTQVCGRCTIR